MYRNCPLGFVIVALGLLFGMSEVADAQSPSGNDGAEKARAERVATAQASGGVEAGVGRASVLELVIQDLQETRELLITEVRALKEEVQALRDVVARDNVWEPFGNSLKNVVENTVEYEYAVVRNGAFRTLTASEWNTGWRVMTSEYMTRDSPPFVVGGSMWTWGTNDSRERECGDGVLHHYYYNTGAGTTAVGGNGCRQSEGRIFRRRR